MLTIALAVCFSCSAYAQTDTSSNTLNLGRIKLQKGFTQSITIKGEELERMPFTNLYDAINAWSYGYFYQGSHIVYVIDGLIINDVNAISIHAIREITLVQNAAVQVNGAGRQQQLAVITTKQGGTGKQGLTVAGQSYLVKSISPYYITPTEPTSEENFFHQYQVSAYRNDAAVQYGLSANYLRDVTPAMEQANVKTTVPNNIDRFRINAWFGARLGSAHHLSVRLHVMPQIGDQEVAATDPSASRTEKAAHRQTILNPVITLRSGKAEGFSNEFTASYGYSRIKGSAERTIMYTNFPSNFNSITDNSTKTRQVVIMDQANYRIPLKHNWFVEPSVNFTFRYYENDVRNDQRSINNGTITGTSWYTTSQLGRVYLLTPSVNLYYSNSFNIQGGILANLSETGGFGQKIRKVLPFVTTSVDVLRLSDRNHPTSLQFFGSYAQNDQTGDIAFNLTHHFNTVAYTGPSSGGMLLPVGVQPYRTYDAWQAGSRLSAWNERLTVNYVYEQRRFTSEVYVPIPSTTDFRYVLTYPELSSQSHHANVQFTLLNKRSLYWRSGLTATNLNITSKEPMATIIMHSITGDINGDHSSWTGGWVNRFSWKGILAGMDISYLFTGNNLFFANGDKIKALSVQNVYLGYNLALKGTKQLEVYADCRNLAQHEYIKLGGYRKYYGLGAKVVL